MGFISNYGSGLHARIVDVGGGTNGLVDALVRKGYKDISVLDISRVALASSAKRLGAVAEDIDWIQTDILDFQTDRKFDIWHDRATFHFLTDETEIDRYLQIASESIVAGGLLIVATFSENGPDICSSLPVHQYSQEQLEALFSSQFIKLECINSDHITPRSITQNFTYCAFRKKA
jgi:trans-aconitate methyltransferase